MLCIARGKQRPGKNAIAFGERHLSPGLTGGYGLWVQVRCPQGCVLLPDRPAWRDRAKKKVPSVLSVPLW